MPEENWALIEGLCIILNIFLKATEKLSGEKYSTFVYAFPLLCHVLQHLGSQLFTPNSLQGTAVAVAVNILLLSFPGIT
jgi:hypothetical protein